ncbi:MAG: c-type cytochrome [Candidatus Thiodiazotropha sp. (ex Troendleina suluensis)]|nr:c-type cytochrome [Candidatus Thiodiazotropha sp. (ex Troendleina suluensis)]
MKRIIFLILVFLIPGLSMALDTENAKKINRTCALCHGVYGQGTPGTLSPRLAGLPASYLAKELRYYRDGVRVYAPMVVSSQIKKMTDKDIDDISEYLAGVDLRNLNLPKIPEYPNGKKEHGKKIYNRECKSCHRKTGQGKANKGIPPIAGQYGSYIFSQFKKFQAKERHHDDDPEDDTFDEWKDTELDSIIAFITKLPPHGPLKKKAAFAMTTSGMSGMAGMESMITMSGDQISMQAVSGGGKPMKIAGKFRITPTGEIVLNPLDQDMRSIAGLSGDFQITPTGIVFFPKQTATLIDGE